MTVEVLEIRQNKDSKTKHIVRGELDISIKGTEVVVRNIPYTIKLNGKVFVNFFQQRKRSVYFQDKTFEESVFNVIIEAVLEHHKDKLPKVTESKEKQP